MNASGLLRRLTLSRGYRRVVDRPDGPLPPHRASARLSAYVYGNILVLAAVATASPESIAEGHACLVVLFTGLTTYVAHVFSEFVAHVNVSDGTTADRLHALQELVDARPIASSATMPTVALALGWLDILPTSWAFVIAGGIVVFRIATIAIITQRIRGNPLTPHVFVAGLITAAVAAVIVIGKVILTH